MIKSGLFEQMWKAGLLKYDNKKELELKCQAIDGTMTKASLCGAGTEAVGTGAYPNNRGKKVLKRVF